MIEYTIQPTRKGQFIVRNPMGNECAKLDTRVEAEAWIERKHEQERLAEAANTQARSEQDKFDAGVPDLNKLQIRWQNWRNWFYSNLVHEDRSLGQHRRALDMIPDGAQGELGTSGSPSYARHEQRLTEDQIEQEKARSLYEQAVHVDTRIKAARRSKNQDELARLLLEDAEPIIAQMSGFFPHMARPEEYKRPANRPGTKPDISLFLGDNRKAWLQAQGGIQPTIQQLIDQAMK